MTNDYQVEPRIVNMVNRARLYNDMGVPSWVRVTYEAFDALVESAGENGYQLSDELTGLAQRRREYIGMGEQRRFAAEILAALTKIR